MNKNIVELEERLRVAMLNSDVGELDSLISSELLFTNHLGHLISKDQDLEAHRNKVFQFESLALSEFEILSLNSAAVVSVKAEVKGFYNGQQANGDFRFTRVWSNKSGDWRVIAGHSCLIA